MTPMLCLHPTEQNFQKRDKVCVSIWFPKVIIMMAAVISIMTMIKITHSLCTLLMDRHCARHFTSAISCIWVLCSTSQQTTRILSECVRIFGKKPIMNFKCPHYWLQLCWHKVGLIFYVSRLFHKKN